MNEHIEPTIEDDFFSKDSEYDHLQVTSRESGPLSDSRYAASLNESSSQFPDRVKAIAKRWGWSEPTLSVLREAEIHNAVHTKRLKTLDVMVVLDLITPEQVEEVLLIQRESRQKGINRRAYDIAAELSVNKQLVEDSKNRVLAASNNIQYIENIDNASVRLHESMFGDNEAVRAKCLEMNAVLCRIQNGTPVIIFGEFGTEYQKFTNMGRPEKQKNAIYKALIGEGNTRPAGLVFALAHPDVVSNASKNIVAGKDSAETEQKISIAALLADKDKEKQKFGQILRHACSIGASDIHIDPKEYYKAIPIILKVHGAGRELPTSLEPTMAEYQKIKDYVITISGGSDSFGQRILLPQDGHFVVVDEADNRFNIRCSFIPDGNVFTFTEQLVSINMRVIKHGTGAVDLASSNVPEEVIELLRKNVQLGEGATYIVGPTGSGKSTTMFGMVEEHRRMYGGTKTRLSFEDPVERDAPGIQQTQVSKKAKAEYDNPFDPYAKAMLRHAPNMILFGEVRDGDSAIAVGSASATGHYVLTSLHAQTPATAIERLLNMVPNGHRHMVMENLGMIIGQRLIPTLCDNCKVERECSTEERNSLNYWLRKKGQISLMEELPERMYFKHEAGCEHCRYQGKSGIAPVYEVVDLYPEHKSQLLKPDADIDSIIHSARHKSMQESAMDLLLEGRVDITAFLG